MLGSRSCWLPASRTRSGCTCSTRHRARSDHARAAAVHASRRAAALRVSARRLIVVFAIVLAPGLSYPLRLYMLYPPSCALRPCARCGHTRFKTRGGSTRLRLPIDCRVRDRAGSWPLVLAPAAHALPAIVSFPEMRALRPYALQPVSALRVSARPLIVGFAIMLAPGLSYPLRLHILCQPSCVFR